MAHPAAPQVTVGVDTHLDVHVAHAADQLGRRVDTLQVPTTPAGYQDLLAWARGLGQVDVWGVDRAPAFSRFVTIRAIQSTRRRSSGLSPTTCLQSVPGGAHRPPRILPIGRMQSHHPKLPP
jgi:hypothetical protein